MSDLRELDKKIAEMKGLKWFGKEPLIADADYFQMKSWSSDISDAWELFEEMRQSSSWGFITIKAHDEKYEIIEEPFDAHEMETELSSAPTAPEAIASAWVRWKGAQIGNK